MSSSITPKRKPIAFKASDYELSQMDARAKELGMNRSEYIRYLTRKDIYEAAVEKAKRGE